MQTIPAPRRTIVVFHDAWAYFCQEYGLQNMPLVANPEAEPSAREYTAMVDRIKAEGVGAVFGEAGFSPKLVQRLADDTGVRFIDGLHDDTLGEGETATYIGMMRANVRMIVEALR